MREVVARSSVFVRSSRRCFVDNTFIITVVLILVLFGIVLGIGSFVRRSRAKKFHAQYGAEYDLALKKTGSAKKAQAELSGREKHINKMTIRPLTKEEQARYQVDWTTVQTKFIDEPGKAIGSADHLIMEVMTLRDYPISDFDQRAADISVKYPALVSNYRAARAIAIKNTDQKASTEELRQAMIYYRSLFDELVGMPVAA
jgi:hypothetical protein